MRLLIAFLIWIANWFVIFQFANRIEGDKIWMALMSCGTFFIAIIIFFCSKRDGLMLGAFLCGQALVYAWFALPRAFSLVNNEPNTLLYIVSVIAVSTVCILPTVLAGLGKTLGSKPRS